MSETKVNGDDKTAKLFKRRKRELMRNLGEVEKCNLNPRQAAKNLKMKYITLYSQYKQFWPYYLKEKEAQGIILKVVKVKKEIKETVQEKNERAKKKREEKEQHKIVQEALEKTEEIYKAEYEFAKIVNSVSIYRNQIGTSFMFLINRLNEILLDKEKLANLPFRDILRGVEVLAPYLVEKKSAEVDEREASMETNPHSRLMKTIYAQMNKKIEIKSE